MKQWLTDRFLEMLGNKNTCGHIFHLKEVWHIPEVHPGSLLDRDIPGYPQWTLQTPHSIPGEQSGCHSCQGWSWLPALLHFNHPGAPIPQAPFEGNTKCFPHHGAVDDVTDPAGLSPFHPLCPALATPSWCSAAFTGICHTLFGFPTSFWSTASYFKSFWMPFLKECTPGVEYIERSPARLHFFCSFLKIGLNLSLVVSFWGATCSTLQYLSKAQVQSNTELHINSAPRAAMSYNTT